MLPRSVSSLVFGVIVTGGILPGSVCAQARATDMSYVAESLQHTDLEGAERMRTHARWSSAAAGLCLVIGCHSDSAGPTDRGGHFQASVGTGNDSIPATADAFLRADGPQRNSNYGGHDSLRVRGVPAGGHDTNRVVIRFDQAAIAANLAGRTLTTATLVLTRKQTFNLGTGVTFDVHRLTKAWTEAGATWNCAQDANTANTSADCSGTAAWAMSGTVDAYVTTPTAQATLTDAQQSVLSLDVTADVQAFLAGTPNNGWLIKQNDESHDSRLVMHSSEATTNTPKLVLVSASASIPAMPASWNEDLDSSYSAPIPPDMSVRVWRTRIGIAFVAGASAATVDSVLTKYGAVIVGGSPNSLPAGAYIVSVPDPGASYTAIDSVIALVSAESGVQNAFPLYYRGNLDPRGRFPTDTAGAARPDWLSGSFAVRPWLQVRAPLAWGCETGMYGTSSTRVAVLDLTFDTSHPDFANPLIVAVPPHTQNRLATSGGTLGDPIARSHGTELLSILTAEGDNGTGVAGMLWRSDLRLYSYGNGSQQYQTPTLIFTDAITDAITQNVRVILTSTGIGRIRSANDIEELRKTLLQFVQAGGIFILASGNDSGALPVTSLATMMADTLGLHLTALDAAAAKVYAMYPKQVIFVPAVDRNGMRLPSSNVWTGATALAAPGDSVLVIARSELGGARYATGSSFAAPFVAGLAAALWTMDPTTPVTKIYDYMFDAASQSRRDSLGNMVSPPSTGVAGLYTIDAYGAMSLLSRDRPGSPICGLPVKASHDSLILARATPEVIETGTALIQPSIAQGGRLVAGGAVYPAAGIRAYRLQGSSWAASTVPGFRSVQYLERDTAYIQDTNYVSGGYGYAVPLITIRRNDGSYADGLNFFTGLSPVLAGSTSFSGYEIRVSPDGGSVAFDTYEYDFSSGDENEALYVSPTASGARVPLLSLPGNSGFGHAEDFPFPAAAVWSPDSREVRFTLGSDASIPDPSDPGNLGYPAEIFTNQRTRVLRTSRTGSNTAISIVAGTYMVDPTLSADAAVLSAREFTRLPYYAQPNIANCMSTNRSAVNPSSLLTQSTVVCSSNFHWDRLTNTSNIRASLTRRSLTPRLTH